MEEQLGCEHYNRGCKLICPTCNKDYWCRHCHPVWWRDLALVFNHVLDRSRIFCILSNNNTCHHEQWQDANNPVPYRIWRGCLEFNHRAFLLEWNPNRTLDLIFWHWNFGSISPPLYGQRIQMGAGFSDCTIQLHQTDFCRHPWFHHVRGSPDSQHSNR